MNFVFISPHFPENYWNFCDRLRANGVNVLGIGDAPYETLPALLKSALTEYYRVDNMENYDEMLRAMGFFTFKYGKIDWVESNNEYWLEQDARLRTDFNITTGIKSAEIEKFKNKTELNKFFQQEGPNAANYILEEFVDGEIVTFDGVADANAEPIYAASHVTPDSIMEIAHGKKPMWYYVAPEISPELRKMGEAALKAFGAKSRFFHLEFFRLKTAKPSLGNAGDILGLEVNMRPAGGYTVDMLNYAGGLDLYQIWADMVAFGAAHHPLARYHRYCCCAGRHDELRYRMPHEELLKKYRSCLNAAPRLPEVLAREMGDQLYIASFEDEAAMQAFRRDALARPRE